MILKLVKTKIQLSIFNDIIKAYHSYVPTVKSVGRKIDWIIYDDDGYTILGAIGIGSAVYPVPKDILRHLNITKEEYRKLFNSFGSNWRFCMCVRRKNLGTQILKEFRKQSKIEWKRKYNNELKYIMTFVGEGHDGAVYKADNWSHIGKTSGLPPHKSTSMKWSTSKELNDNFVKPVGGDLQKLIFIKELK